MILFGGLIFAKRQGVIRKLFLLAVFLFFVSDSAFSQTIIKDEYWGGNSGKYRKDYLGQASDVTEMEVLADDERITVTIRGPFFYNYVHKIKGAHHTPPGDLYISSAGWKVKGEAPYIEDTFTKDEGWDYVVSLLDKAVYRLEWSKIEWTRPKPGSVVYRRDQAWRGGYGDFVSWAEIKLTDKELVISFPLHALLQEIIPSSDDVVAADVVEETGESAFDSENMLELGFHWTMMCGNDIIEGAFVLPATIYSDYEEAEEFPLPRPTAHLVPVPPPLVPWHRDFRQGTLYPFHFHRSDRDPPPPKVPEPSTFLLLLSGFSAIGVLIRRKK